MAKYTVHLETTASMTVTVDVPDDLDPEESIDKAVEEAHGIIPSGVCAQCSDWGRSWSLDMGEWDLARDSDGAEIMPERMA